MATWGPPWVKGWQEKETHTQKSRPGSLRLACGPGASPGGHEEWACTRGLAGRGPPTCLPRGPCTVVGGWVSWASAQAGLGPSLGPLPSCLLLLIALAAPPAWGPLPRRSPHHAPPLPVRGRGPELSLPQRAAGGVLCSRTPSWGQQWRAMRRGARPRGAAAGRNSHVARPLPRCLPQGGGLQGAQGHWQMGEKAGQDPP